MTENLGKLLGLLAGISDEKPREQTSLTPQVHDRACPFIEWMGEDLAQCPGVGEWKCKIQEYHYGDLLAGGGSENTDYQPCRCSNHNACKFYLARQTAKTP